MQTYEGNMNATKYLELLEGHFISKADEIMGKGMWTLQQDGARAHTAKKVSEMFKRKGVNSMKWPTKSPDLNPIENVWGILKNKVYRRNPQNVGELRKIIYSQ